jgi:SAM-dependent methyltransferase
MSITCPTCASLAKPTSFQLGGYELYACPACELKFAPAAFGMTVDYSGIYETSEYVENQVDQLSNASDMRAFAELPTYRPFFTRVRPHGDATLIDIGCGVGRFCHAAASYGWKVEGVDTSEKAIAIGSRHANFPLRALTLEEVIAGGEKYDVATAFEVLEHLSDPRAFLNRMQMVLKAGGEAFCTVPNWNCKDVQRATRPDWLPPVHLIYFVKKSLAEIARQAGFTNVAVGEIWTDALPSEFGARVRWMARRALGRPNIPLGLWLHAWGISN